MKKKFFVVFMFLFALVISFVPIQSDDLVYANDAGATILAGDDDRLSSDYLDFYAVSNKFFSYSNNGGERGGNALSRAFDRNFNTHFESQSENVNGFVNSIEVVFNKAVELDRIIYGSERGTTRGFPKTLNIYYKLHDGWELLKSYQTNECSDFVLFQFENPLVVNAIKLDFSLVSTKHRYTATAREILFLQPESEAYLGYKNLFDDYSQTTLSANYNSYQKVCELESSLLGNVNFSSSNEKIERAKNVALGYVVFDHSLEFSTGFTTNNVIERYGDLAGYCRNTLQLSSFGTNRQVTGILAYAGEEVNIYVSANAGDPLPRVRFSQAMGHWRSWLGGENQLKLGKNTFVVPSYYHQDYTVDVALGGSIYLVNPYNESEQSDNVKVYIEGGHHYPVMRYGKDENLYKKELDEYCQMYEADSKNVANLTEIVSDHTIVTVQATRAREIYSAYSPQSTLTNWDDFMDELLEFGGIPQNNDNNMRIRHNLRVVQPWPGGFMFAAGEHIGVLEGSQTPLIYGSGFGWGVAHEIGHALDNKNRVVGECSNNMWAKYNETAIEQANKRGDFAQTLLALSNDKIYANSSYFNSNRYNFLIWWYIETWHSGFWGELDNCYRGLNQKLNNFFTQNSQMNEKLLSMTSTEKQVFYSSIVTGIDMTYYFDRWGYTIGNKPLDKPEDNTDNVYVPDPVFRADSVSSAYQEIMECAVGGGFVDNTQKPKLWYQNSMAFHEKINAPIYSSATSVSVESVTKTTGGYNIFVSGGGSSGHLGYEIYEGNDTDGYKVIGFSYSRAYTDTTEYPEGYIPSYKVVAVDKLYATSAESGVASVDSQTDVVCKIGEIGFTSLVSAVKSANSGDTILLLESFVSPSILVDKNITIAIAENVLQNITIKKIENANLFVVSSGCTLTLKGNAVNKIILDGNGFEQSGTLINCNGVLNCSYVSFVNNITTGNGGAIVMSNSNRSAISTITFCDFSGNEAYDGSAYFCGKPESAVTFENCKFENNKATNQGVIKGKGTLTLNDCDIKNNTSKIGTIVNFEGGILKVNSCLISGNVATKGAGFYLDGSSEITDTEISNNSASEMCGGLYYQTSVGSRKITLTRVVFSGNLSPLYNDLYIAGVQAIFNGVTTSGESSIALVGGLTKLNNDCNLHSTIVIKNGINVSLVGGLFGGISECLFDTIDFANEMRLLASENYTLASDDLASIRSANNKVYFVLESGEILAKSNMVVLSLEIDGNITTREYNLGDEVTLDFEVGDNKYVVKYIEADGAEYVNGDKVIITKDLNFTAILGNKVKVKIAYYNSVLEAYYIPYSTITLPIIADENRILWGYDSEDGFYGAGDHYVVTKDIQLVAKYATLFRVVVICDGETVFDGYMKYGSKIDFEAIGIDAPDYLTYNGKRIDSDFRVKNDVTLVAHYEKDSNIKAIVVAILLCLAVVVAIVGVSVYVKKKK